jgi:hypothetical protein
LVLLLAFCADLGTKLEILARMVIARRRRRQKAQARPDEARLGGG